MFFGMWNSEKANGFWLGVGTVVAGFVLIPALRNSLRPMAVRTVQGAMSLKEQGQEFINEVRRTNPMETAGNYELHLKEE
ncbi:MAG: hypothetical protein M0Z31_12075 [Clostridia bacterium]|nr:hypothetical protein [Clostridia bacterium]